MLGERSYGSRSRYSKLAKRLMISAFCARVSGLLYRSVCVGSGFLRYESLS